MLLLLFCLPWPPLGARRATRALSDKLFAQLDFDGSGGISFKASCFFSLCVRLLWCMQPVPARPAFQWLPPGTALACRTACSR